MEFDLRMLLSVGAVFASVVAAMAIARHQIGAITDQLEDFKASIRQLDNRLDRIDVETNNLRQRVNILTDISAPSNLEAKVRELTSLGKDVEHIKEEIRRLARTS